MKKIFKRFTVNTGSMTVEASIIFPIIILAIVAVIYICVLLYQYVHLKSVVNNTAERGAACWGNISKMEIDNDNYRVETGELKNSEELLNSGLYWRITGAQKYSKIKSLKKYAIYKLKKNNILESEISKLEFSDIENKKDRIDIWVKDYIVYKELNVIVKDSYNIPLGESLRIFGMDNKYNIEIHAKAIINDPMEFIRNANFIGDTLKEYEKTEEILNKFKEAVDKIKENIDKFFQNEGGAGD